LMEIKGIIDEREKERVREQFIQSAFTAFQMGAANKMTFVEYLNHLGLSDGQPPRREAQATTADSDLFALMGIKVKKAKK